jgi:hypothetical protein
MRSSLSFTACAPLALATLAFLAGCNLVFGLDPVSEKGGLCPDSEPADSLIDNGSFEQDMGWNSPLGKNVELEYVPAESCDMACGDRMGRLTGSCKPGEQTTLVLSQNLAATVELGGVLRLDARYRFEADSAPYFRFDGNGYGIGNPTIKGTPEGDHLVVDFTAAVDDPRRTGDHVLFSFQQNIGNGETMAGGEADVLLDCISATYEPPPGDELLLDGWFESSMAGWEAQSDATLQPDTTHGKCGYGGGHVTIAAGVNAEVLRTTVTGPWEEGTTFTFGGAVGPPSFDPLELVPCGVVLHLEYTDDQLANTPDFAEIEVPATTMSEPWKKATGTLLAARPVTAASLRLVADNSGSGSPAELLADCFSLRAVP